MSSPSSAIFNSNSLEATGTLGALRRHGWIGPFAAFVAISVLGMLLGSDVPTWLDAHVRPATDRLYQ